MSVPPAFVAAPLDGQARLVLVAWLCGWFALAAALLGMWVGGAGRPALAAAMLVTVTVPVLVVVRLAGLPAAYEVAGEEVLVHRYLAPARSYRLAGPARRERGALRLRGRRVLLGGGYGCRTVDRAAEGSDRHGHVHLHLATTNLADVVRVETTDGPLLLSPADVDGLLRAVAGTVRE